MKFKKAILASALACTFALSTPMLVGCGDDQKIKDLETQVTTLTEKLDNIEKLTVFEAVINSVYTRTEDNGTVTDFIFPSQTRYTMTMVLLKNPQLGKVYHAKFNEDNQARIKFAYENNKYYLYTVAVGDGANYFNKIVFTYQNGKYTSIENYNPQASSGDSDHGVTTGYVVRLNAQGDYSNNPMTEAEKTQCTADKTAISNATLAGTFDFSE